MVVVTKTAEQGWEMRKEWTLQEDKSWTPFFNSYILFRKETTCLLCLAAFTAFESLYDCRKKGHYGLNSSESSNASDGKA